ncbi:hypothetical protein [uncultured Lamprocystis sp.]|uniref:hypothetical protein n=1 Tax=uncultured Lamprocystis sp. TaxID=543132 RepID=UPI0025CF5D89|nr:hypothetical protein [uncultured Lamprocystis sp.]
MSFEIEISDNSAETLSVAITVGADHRVVYQEDLHDDALAVGTHEWRWDGYSNGNVLDTKVLKDPTLELRLQGTRCGVRQEQTIRFDNEAKEQDWVDVVIDRGAGTVQVELRVDLRDGGAHGVGEVPPAEIFATGATPNYSVIPANDPRRQAHVRQRSFDDLKNLAVAGLARYWSRDAGNGLIISTDHGDFQVATRPRVTTEQSMDDVGLEYNTNGDWGRSSNPGSVRGFFSFIANIFIPERTIYNAGWIKYDGGWVYQNLADEDQDFSHTSAHEIGHEILSAYGGEDYSYGHRGSSTVITQSTLNPAAGGVTYPAAGEIDLMKYYNGVRPYDFFARNVASMQDVKSLIWLARVEFDD